MRRWVSMSALLSLSVLAACGGTGATAGSGGASSSTAQSSSGSTSGPGASGSAGSTSGASGTGGASSSSSSNSSSNSSSTNSSSSSSGSGGGGGNQGASRVDLVVGVDNSRSMADKQTVLALALPGLVGNLVNPLCLDANGKPALQQPQNGSAACPAGTTREFTPLTDIHIGIVTTSLGGHGADACSPLETASCAGQPNPSNDDAGHLVSRSSACAVGVVPTYQTKGFLAWDPAQTLMPPGEANLASLNKNFHDLVLGAGQVGCGFESQLESWYRFLIDPDPYASITVVGGQATPMGTDAVLLQQRVDFLRPDSVLAIMMLSDEDDCSTKEFGQFFYANQIKNPANPNQSFHLPRARAECAQNPNDVCCKSCGQAVGNCPLDMACQSSPTLSAAEDDINLRCWDQKRRFGIDFLYPLDRYAQGLTAKTVPDRLGNLVPNPIFTDLDPNDNITAIRASNMVFLLGIVGVPWQDIARDPQDLAKGYKDAAELGALQNGITRWDVILGDLATNVPPKDPLMIESTQPRSGQNPITGNPVAPPGSPPNANPINGHEYTIATKDDLQYACVFPLATPVDCSNPNNIACDCSNPNNDSPVCAPNPNNSGNTLQVKAKAYPGRRQIGLLKQLGTQGVVASICPSQTADVTKADYAYVPASRALIERIKPRLK